MGASFVVLGLGEAIARVIAFGATTFVARTAGAEAYGMLAVSSAIVLYFSQLANFSVELLGARELARRIEHPGADTREPSDRATREQTAVAACVPSLLLLRLGIATVCVALLVGFALLALPRQDGTVLAITAFTLFAVAGSSRFVFVALERPAPAALASVIGEVLTLAMIVRVVDSASDVGAAAALRALGDAIPPLLMLWWLRTRGFSWRWTVDRPLVRPIAAAALPLVAHAILGLAIYNSDLIFLRVLRDARTAGMYAAAYALLSFLLNLGVTYGTSILPSLSRSRREVAPDAHGAPVGPYQTAMLQVVSIALPIAVGGSLVTDGLLPLVFGPTYGEAIRPMQILLWTVLPAFVRNVAQMGLIACDQQAFILRASAWSAAANIVLNVLLIPRWGMEGAALATLLTEAGRALANAIFAARVGHAFGIWSSLWRPMLASVVMGALLAFVPLPHVLIAIALGMVTYGAVLMLVGGVRLRHGRVEFPR